MEIDLITQEIIKMHRELLDDRRFKYNYLLNKLNSEKSLQKILERTLKNLRHHIFIEEKILFPYIINLAKAARNEALFEKPYFQSVTSPISIMESDHETIKEGIDKLKIFLQDEINLKQINSVVKENITNFIELVTKVIYLENKILFPKAIALEKKFLK